MLSEPIRRGQMRKGVFTGVTLATLASAFIVVACSESSAPAIHSPAAGLSKIEANNDSTPTPPPDPGTAEAGSFHGFVFGLGPSGSGPDTMANAVKLQGVRVAAYPYLLELNDDGSPKTGPEEAAVFTDADGAFQFPALKGGVYVVTFKPQPPNDATWYGAW